MGRGFSSQVMSSEYRRIADFRELILKLARTNRPSKLRF